MKLPNFIVIGAQKGGTTTLQKILESHSKVYMPKIKETQYYSLHHEKGLEWYSKHFTDAKWYQKKGEITPYYLYHPDAAKRIYSDIPRTKIVALLRDPVERTISHIYHAKRLGFENLEPLAAIQAEKTRLGKGNAYSLQKHSYISRSKYIGQLARYEKLFPEKNICIIKSEDLFEKPEATWEYIEDFIGIRREKLPKIMPKMNTGKGEASSIDKRVVKILRNELRETAIAVKVRYGIDWKWQND